MPQPKIQTPRHHPFPSWAELACGETPRQSEIIATTPPRQQPTAAVLPDVLGVLEKHEYQLQQQQVCLDALISHSKKDNVGGARTIAPSDDDVQSRIHHLEDEVKHMKSRLQEKEAATGQANGMVTAQADEGFRVSQRKSMSSFVKVQMESISMKPSSWEVVAVVGSEGFDRVGSMVVVFVVVLNILLQTVFCFISIIGLTEDDFDDEARSEYEQWRVSAHELSQMDRVRGETLVQRVCDLDGSLSIGTKQLLVRETIQRYTDSSVLTGGVPAGEMMCMLALLVWYLTLGGELNAMYDYVSAIMHIPAGPFQIVVDTADDMSDAVVTLASLGICRKSACYFITFARLIIAGCLACVGTLALVHTNSVGDLILNALALEMILKVDEYLFACMVPAHVQKFVNMLSPVRMSLRQWHGLTFQIFSGFVLVPMSTVLVYFTMVAPHVEDLLAVERSLCYGNLNFAYNIDASGFAHATEDLSIGFAGIAGHEMTQITLDAVKLAAWDGVSQYSPQNMLHWQRDISYLEFIQGVRNVSHLQELTQSKCKDLLKLGDCSKPVLYVRHSECPAGYMNPRDPSECRSAAIALGLWDESRQEQQSRAKVEADIEEISAASPCLISKKENRTIWANGPKVTTGAESDDIAPCICEPKTAATYQRFATILHGVPVQECEQLLQMGACTLENPRISGSWSNASVTRWLCPETCGCNLIPKSPLRTVFCPSSCHLVDPAVKHFLNRKCTDLSADELQQTRQMIFFVADLRSTKVFQESWGDEVFLDELQFRGCSLVWALRNPYGSHSADEAPPCPPTNNQEQLRCLALRCQDFDPEYCNIHIQNDKIGPHGLPEGCTSDFPAELFQWSLPEPEDEKWDLFQLEREEEWNDEDEHEDDNREWEHEQEHEQKHEQEREQQRVIPLFSLCPRTCGTCSKIDLCRGLEEQESRPGKPFGELFPNSALWSGEDVAQLFRGYCPHACECSSSMNGCPRSCFEYVAPDREHGGEEHVHKEQDIDDESKQDDKNETQDTR